MFLSMKNRSSIEQLRFDTGNYIFSAFYYIVLYNVTIIMLLNFIGDSLEPP